MDSPQRTAARAKNVENRGGEDQDRGVDGEREHQCDGVLHDFDVGEKPRITWPQSGSDLMLASFLSAWGERFQDLAPT
jgi:hypothetical protein